MNSTGIYKDFKFYYIKYSRKMSHVDLEANPRIFTLISEKKFHNFNF